MQDRTEIKTDDVRPKREAARQLDVAERSIDRIIALGLLPVVEISPRRIGVLQSDIDAFKLSRRRVRGSPAAVEADQSEHV
jgi:hypothetical protein